MRMPMSVEKKIVTPSVVKKSRSIWRAISLARGGKSGASRRKVWPGCMSAFPVRAACRALPLAPDHHDDERAERDDREKAGRPHRADRDETVFPDLRIVVVTEQKKLIDDAAELVLRRLDERQAKILRCIFDTEQVARDLPFRREDEDTGGMC